MDDLPQTIVETKAFVDHAKRCMSDEERHQAIDMIAEDPECGVRLAGGHGVRKVRFAIAGRGKSGGVRIVYYYQYRGLPVFLLTVFAKNEKSDLSPKELADLAKAAQRLALLYGDPK
ncbi:MAG: type II toxin-antitoxin system RelE/ParE family toxin [Rhodospirillales bacterium]|nr:type II toxin-antitoxin system RelE/ParE family toxin [Rhodospirillales bacterium]